MALFAALAGLAALGIQGVIFAAGVGVLPIPQDLAPLLLSSARWAQLSFILMVTLFLFVFGLSKRPAA